MLHASTIWHLWATPPWRKQWGHCDSRRILVASEVTTEITSTPPAPRARVCGGQPWVTVLDPLSGHPGKEAERHFATVPVSAIELKYCHGWRPAGQRVPSKTGTGQHTCAKAYQKPSMFKVILRAVADKRTCKYVSLATLKKAVSTTGYDMAQNAYHFKHVLKGLVDKGSSTLGKKQASKSKLKVKRQRQQRWRSGQRPFGQHRSLLGSKQGHKRLIKRVRRVAKCHCN
ncbi:putative histone H1.9 [Pongo abelii]|uniref:putative histone H1.9 n=1 Tax=Pongo abelii TaxID=9601 RepID=UPI00300723E0